MQGLELASRDVAAFPPVELEHIPARMWRFCRRFPSLVHVPDKIELLTKVIDFMLVVVVVDGLTRNTEFSSTFAQHGTYTHCPSCDPAVRHAGESLLPSDQLRSR